MSKNRTGNFIAGGAIQSPSLTSANGVFDQKDVYTAVNSNAWPATASGYYEIPKSLRFRSSASTYLNRVPSISGNRTTWTWSAWVKWTGGSAQLFGVTSGSGSTSTQENDRLAIQHSSDGQFQFYELSGGSFTSRKYTLARFRDPSAWYHLMVSVDYTKSTADDRIKMYVNGIQQSQFESTTTPSQNMTSWMNGSGNNHTIGGQIKQYYNFYDGYISEHYLIDGQALDPSYFGYFDNAGIWQPKKYTGGYGTNGFYLPFSDNQSTLNLGRNYGVASNYLTYSEQMDNAAWTKYNCTITANATTAPDGTTTADKIAENSTTNIDHSIWTASNIFGSTNIRVYTSVYVKAAERNYAQIQLSNMATAAAWVDVDLTNGTFKVIEQTADWTGTVGNVVAVGNGWYKVTVSSIKGTANGTTKPNYLPANTFGNVTYAGTVGSGIYIWGAQMGYGYGANDSYVSTTSSTVNNDWALNNFSLTPGITYDSMVDSPTNVFTTATDIGGVVSGNYPTFNSIDGKTNSLSPIYSNGNLTLTNSYFGATAYAATMMVPRAGKWYYETVYTTIGNNVYPGIRNYFTGVDYQYSNNGTKSGGSAYGDSWTTNDVIGIAIDSDNSQITFYKNGVSQGALSVSGNIYDYDFAWNNSSPYPVSPASVAHVNFGQRPFAYTPPAGYKSLNTTNLQALGTTVVGKAGLQPNKWFDTTLYGGTGTVRNVVNSGFEPDLVWLKSRSSVAFHSLWNSVTPSLALTTNDTMAEQASGAGGDFISFNKDGFTVGPNINWGSTNQAGQSIVAWQWKQSPTSGFNIVSYTGTGSNMTISHNLGVAPKFIMIKERTSVSNWVVQHDSLGWDKGFLGITTAAATTSTAFSNNTAPTASNFTVSSYSNGDNTLTRKYIAYLWAEVPGFSKFGSYTGNGSADGPFIYCGFKPKWIMIKNYNAGAYSAGWTIIDTTRSPNNVAVNAVQADVSSAEFTYATPADILSNGFKIRTAWDSVNNPSPILYVAFAENPFALNNRAR